MRRMLPLVGLFLLVGGVVTAQSVPVPVPVSPDNPGLASITPLADKLGLAILIPWLIQQMKTSQLPFFSFIGPFSTKLARSLSIGGAAASTVGIIFRYDPAAETLLITGIGAWSLLQFVFEFLKQFAMQEATYRAAFKPVSKIPET